MRTETIVWTALPNGRTGASSVRLSVFVSPQLQTDEGGANPLLSLFPDWTVWPRTLATPALRFEVTFAGHPAVVVAPDLSGLSPTRWQALFDPATTGVTSYSYQDYAGTTINSFNAQAVQENVSKLYGQIGVASGVLPPVLSFSTGQFVGGREVGSLVDSVANLTRDSDLYPLKKAVVAARDFHLRPPVTLNSAPVAAPYVATVPTLDFHQAVSSLGSYPAVLRLLGLVFDLEVPLPAALVSSTTDFVVNVRVVPRLKSHFDGTGDRNTVNVSLETQSALTPDSFRPAPDGLDYRNGMLDLADPARFSVIDLDVDGASEQLVNLSQALNNITHWVAPQSSASADGATLAMTTPALRSTGPSIVWSGWGTPGAGLNALAAAQTNISTAVTNWVTWYLKYHKSAVRPPAPALPVLGAVDVIRGHRFDVWPLNDHNQSWCSLHQRLGTYIFGTEAAVALPEGTTPGLDEGTSVPGATSQAGMTAPSAELWVHESIARWAGWSLAAPRPGNQIDPNDSVHASRNNPAVTTPDAAGQVTPQLSASFQVAPGTLPKLRFGWRYRYRARGVDLAGNSVPLDVNDATTATAPVTHYRYEPVASPVVVPTAPLVPGEAVLLLAVRDYQAAPAMAVTPNSRWLFPPRVSEMMAEEHGMLDGFRAGLPPELDKRPAGDAATYQMLGGTAAAPGRADAVVTDVAQVATDPTTGTPYLAATAHPSTPWLPAPLGRGVTISGFVVGTELFEWAGGRWPSADPVLVILKAGPLARHRTAATASAPATLTVSLPAADVLDLRLSSNLTSPETLGAYHWMLAETTTAAQRADLAVLALAGELWMLTPFRVLRLVNAVRLPLVAPHFVFPLVGRGPGSTQASILDRDFRYDGKSTADIAAEAVWTDPLDDPSTNEGPATATVTSHGHAFQAHIPDPSPVGAFARPMEVIAPLKPVPIVGSAVVHNIGDTLHHVVEYTCTATSRYAEFFKVTVQVSLVGTGPAVITGTAPPGLGVDPNTVTVHKYSVVAGQIVLGAELVRSPTGAQSTTNDHEYDYVVDASAGTIALLSSSLHYHPSTPLAVQVVSEPPHTLTGPTRAIEILSTAPPKAPVVARVSPAWSIDGPTGTAESGLNLSRTGGYVRVYLERPWFSSGAGEVLGVVGITAAQLDGGGTILPAGLDPSLVTMMGLDPISASSQDRSYPVVPSRFSATASVPPVPYRTPYASPPELSLLENPLGPTMQIWPYEVNFDPVSNYWYADVNITVGANAGGPPPGYFVRLALVRFQPYSIAGAEISHVTLATFAQPVANRSVSVTQDKSDSSGRSVFVTVSGPGYYGFRPPNPKTAAVQVDSDNPYSAHTYSTDPGFVGGVASSTMIVEVQVQDTSTGLSGDLAWTAAPGLGPVMLTPSFKGQNEVVWSRSSSLEAQPLGLVLPAALGSGTPMRLRISELDYYAFEGSEGRVTPAAVNTSFRRPFVALIPIS